MSKYINGESLVKIHAVLLEISYSQSLGYLDKLKTFLWPHHVFTFTIFCENNNLAKAIHVNVTMTLSESDVQYTS